MELLAARVMLCLARRLTWELTVNLSTLDGTNGFRLDGEAAGDRSGYSVSSAGDVNGDGYDDLIIGADGADPNGMIAARVMLCLVQAMPFASQLIFRLLTARTASASTVRLMI